MKKSLIAAAFATVLPMSAMAQDVESTQQAPETSDTACTQISATEQFCVALQNGMAPVIKIETPQGTALGMPGVKIDNEGNIERCLGIVDRNLNLHNLICEGDEQQSQPSAQPEIYQPN